MPLIHHRLPRCGVDPIDDAASAWHVISLALHRPLRPETIVLLADAERRGLGLVVVTGTTTGDEIVDVVDRLTHPGVHDGRAGAVVVASTLPPPSAPAGRDDLDRWLEMSDLTEQHGVVLLEWFCVAATDDGRLRTTCPRDTLGELPRWPPLTKRARHVS